MILDVMVLGENLLPVGILYTFLLLTEFMNEIRLQNKTRHFYLKCM